jgi:hypothetical protein
MRYITFAFSTFLCASSLTTAHAQNDHYNCYKAKDTAKVFKSATADLTAFQVQFAAENCAIKAKSKQVCVPASKTVTAIVDGTDAPFPAQNLTDLQICYKIKCPKVAIAPIEVSDQFGTRNIEKFKASTLCVPAVLQ